MTNRQKEQWSKLYYFTQICSEMEPWDRFSEAFPLVYIQKDTGKEIVFSILGNKYPFCGYAVYDSWYEFSMARNRMRGANKKNEPLFLLQNAMVGVWGSRSDIGKENYAVMKELNLRGHGDGTWLHFEKYRVGYVPSALSESEVAELADSMANLLMILRAVFERGMDTSEPGTMLIRTYDPKTKLFNTGILPLLPLMEPSHPTVTVMENENLLKLAALPSARYTMELDWSYLSMPIRENGIGYIPRLLIGTDGSGFVLFSNLLHADGKPHYMVIEALGESFEKHGKPKEIKINDDELKETLADFCRQVGVPLRVVKNLPQVNRFRNSFLKDIRA